MLSARGTTSSRSWGIVGFVPVHSRHEVWTVRSKAGHEFDDASAAFHPL